MMRLHYLQHVPFEGLGSIKVWANARQMPISMTRIFANDPFPALRDIDLLVVLGAPMGVADVPAAEKQFIEQAIRAEKRVLGICLGSQIVAEVLGARVYRNPQEEIGWFPIQFTQAGQARFPNLPAETTVFHWHGDTFDLPNGAVHLASSEGCNNQMFAYGERVIGVQFHPEVTPEGVSAMFANENAAPAGKYVQPVDQVMAEKTHFAGMRQMLEQILAGLNLP